jgi:hypothetical protein
MPDETSLPATDLRKSGAPASPEDREWIFKPLDEERRDATRLSATLEIECARQAARSRGITPGPTRMFHSAGRFRDQSGVRFDYLFPELLEDPALPAWVFERVPFLLRGTTDRFQPRRTSREAERIVVGLRYGHGDLPRMI